MDKTTKLKHTSAVAKITLPEASGVGTDGDGVVGFIFHVVENDDGSNTFGLAGLRRNKNNIIEYYVSYYKNVNVKEHLNLKSDFCDMNGYKIGEAGCSSETKDEGPQKSLTTLGITASAGQDCVVFIQLVAGGPDTDEDGKVEDKEGDGSYIVKFYQASDWDEATNAPKAGKSPKVSETIESVTTGDVKATQYKLGLYTNAYNGCTLKGRMDIVDTINECEIEFED